MQVRDLNSGTFGFVELALDKITGQQVAIKFIERGDKVRVYLMWEQATKIHSVAVMC